MVNFAYVKGSQSEVYVTAMYLPPGKNQVLIRTPITTKIEESGKSKLVQRLGIRSHHNHNDDSFRWYYRQQVSNIRLESVPLL